MKMPRTIRILQLMTNVIFSILHNEPLLLRGNLAQLDELGGIYIKFLQVVVLNLNPDNQENFMELLNVYERSKPDVVDIRQYLIENKLPNAHKLASVASQPFATGSFGQVYQGQLQSGEAVIVKILRPGVRRYLNYDLRLLKIISALYSLVDRQKMLNFKDIYNEFKRTCLQEINYTREAEAADHFYRQYQEHPALVIPKTYLELCSEHIIVQERIVGLSLTDLLNYQAQGTNARQYVAEQLQSDLYDQLYTVGYEILTNALTGRLMQADPHPGNIILLPHNRVALIDFGMTTKLNQHRLAFYDLVVQYRSFYNGQVAIEDLLIAAMEFLTPKLYAAMNSAENLLSGASEERLVDKVRHSARSVTQDSHAQAIINSMLEEKMIMKVLFFAVNKGNRFGLTIDLQSIMLLKAVHAYLTLMAQFDRYESVVITNVLNDVLAYAQQHMGQIAEAEAISLQPFEAIEILSTWFDKMSRNDPWLMQEIAGGYIT
jgi:predicted unusual protein kinase regulating ubiquinone biosynthesis (AarF/ABC1/UbiB family)